MCILRRAAGRGDSLCDARKTRRARSAKSLTAEVSDTAQQFFARRGYEGQQRNSVSIGDEWLANTTMKKTFVADVAQARPQ